MLYTGICVLSVLLAVVLTVVSGALWVLPVALVGSFLALVVLAFLLLWLVCAFVDLEKPQEHDSKFYRFVLNLIVQALPKLLRVRIHTQGLDRLPQDGRFLLVCNHLSDADPVVLLHAFPKAQLAFISKKENRDMFLVGKMMHKIMCQMIDRENDREALKTIIKCVHLIKEDEVSVAVFPEGYTSRDGKLHRFRAGVFKIAMKTQVPIVVCTVKNTRQIFENLPKLKATDVELHLVGVIPAEETQGTTAIAIADRAYSMMLDDLGPDYAPAE